MEGGVLPPGIHPVRHHRIGRTGLRSPKKSVSGFAREPKNPYLCLQYNILYRLLWHPKTNQRKR
nr:MAG TPA_asm: hypothetical protein [Caudoviricetes sp.]